MFAERDEAEFEQLTTVPWRAPIRNANSLRLAHEAADAGLLSPELAAGVRRVKGVKKLGVRLGNWLTNEEARRFLQSSAAALSKGSVIAPF